MDDFPGAYGTSAALQTLNWANPCRIGGEEERGGRNQAGAGESEAGADGQARGNGSDAAEGGRRTGRGGC